MVAVCWYVTAVFEFDRLFRFIDEIFNSMMAHELTTQEKNSSFERKLSETTM